MQTLLPILRTFLEPPDRAYHESCLLSKPWELKGQTYYSNGHIAVRVPCVGFDDQAVSGDFNDLRATVDATVFSIFNTPLACEWLSIPEVKFEKIVCKTCRGTGFSDVCPECDGSGDVEFETSYNQYICDCLSCNGSGSIAGGDTKCSDCWGLGSVVGHRGVPFGNDPALGINAVLLSKMAALPGVRINRGCCGGMFAFHFDLPMGGCGDGIVMGYKL